MCGIIGFTGYLSAPELLVEGLKQLEYRGYDSAGIACQTAEGIRVIKEVGKVAALDAMLPETLHATCGIGHTRWATHGGVTQVNAHPHTCRNVTLIHNGIIENYLSLQMELEAKGYRPVSQTDSEIAAMLLDSLYTGDAYVAITAAVARLEGSYAFCILFSDRPDEIFCIRKGSPLVACCTEEGSVIASDMVALLRFSKDYFVLPENQIARLTKNAITVTTLTGEVVTPEILSVTWDTTAAKKGGFKHFMLKEICEQPEALLRTIKPRIRKDGAFSLPDFTEDHIPDDLFRSVDRIVIAACGTAMYAGLVARILLERLLRIPVAVEIASEFRYQDPILDARTLLITVTQSGETADTLAALRLGRELGAKTLSIVNVKGSSIARESEYVFYTHAGPEIAVASTKAYTAQLAAFYLIAFRFAYARELLTKEACSYLTDSLLETVPTIETLLNLREEIKAVSHSILEAEDIFFIGRGLDYALSWEGSHKLKEISYIHSEAYAAGELKHGTLSLITDGIPVFALATQRDVLAKTVSNIKEVRARGAFVVCIAAADAEIEAELLDCRIDLPTMDDTFAPFAVAVILQLVAYYTSVLRGLDVDQPRNLAKSVTVE